MHFDHLLMYSATILSASFDRGGNEGLKRLINLTKSYFKQVAAPRIEAMQSGSGVSVPNHLISLPEMSMHWMAGWLPLKNQNKIMQNNKNQPKEKKILLLSRL